MEMEQLEAVPEVFRPEHLRGREQLGGAQAELGVLAAALGPFARPFGQEPRPNAEDRLDPQLLGELDDVPQFLQFFHDQDDALAQLDADQGHLDEAGVLVTVADNQAPDLILQRQAGEQFRLAADFQTEIERLARVENLLHDFAELVDLDREDAAVLALVVEFLDGTAKGQVNRLDPVAQDVLEPNQHRELQAARLGFFDHVVDLDARAVLLQRPGKHMPRFVDVKVFRTPTLDVIQIAGVLDVPRRRGNDGISHHFSNERTIGRRAEIATGVSKILRTPRRRDRPPRSESIHPDAFNLQPPSRAGDARPVPTPASGRGSRSPAIWPA